MRASILVAILLVGTMGAPAVAQVTNYEANEVMDSPQFTTIMGVIKYRTGLAEFLALGTRGYLTDAGLRAQADFRRRVLEWMAAHPRAFRDDPLALDGAIDVVAADVLGHIREVTPTEDGQYIP